MWTVVRTIDLLPIVQRLATALHLSNRTSVYCPSSILDFMAFYFLYIQQIHREKPRKIAQHSTQSDPKHLYFKTKTSGVYRREVVIKGVKRFFLLMTHPEFQPLIRKWNWVLSHQWILPRGLMVALHPSVATSAFLYILPIKY